MARRGADPGRIDVPAAAVPPIRRIRPMNNARDFVERALVFLLLILALSGIVFAVSSVAGTGAGLDMVLG